MKRKLLYLSALAFVAFGMQSCLDYDEPGDELAADAVKTSDSDFTVGQVDIIDYNREISVEGVNAAANALKTYFRQSLSGQYSLRGGKEGNHPGSHAYQRQYALGPDAYAQYAVVPHKDFMYGTMTSTYDISSFNSDPHYTYTSVKNSIVPLLNQPQIDSIPEMKAINLLFLSIAAQERCDLSGPFTYFEDKANSQNPTTYNNLKSIYLNIEANLDTIVNCLKYYEENRSADYKKAIEKLLARYTETAYASFSLGEYSVEPYIRTANSLKLSMAMNIVKVEPDLARKWAEEAMGSGVIEDQNHTLGMFPLISGFGHPLIDISESWGDWRLCASFESLLASLDHPYSKPGYLFTANRVIKDQKGNESLAEGTQVIGLRSGELVGDGQNNPPNQRICYSRIVKDNFQLTPLYFIKWSEVDFLCAEAAVRGWDVQFDAKFYYERGIRNGSFEDPLFSTGIYEQAMDAYLQLDAPTAYTQTDPLNGTEDWQSVTKIGVKWNDGDNNETKLEKIITQKYIALFPNSWQAWTDMRRTGYPKVFPVLNTGDGDGSIKQGDMIRRIPWVATEPQVIANINATGIPALGGPDQQATRLWWDVDAPNF